MAREHYYSSSPTSAHRPREFMVKARGHELLLKTDAGVFAKEHLDRGTRLLLEAVQVPAGARRLADLGCGYGPVGLTLALLAPAAQVIMIDPNERACALAQANAIRNRLANVMVIRGEGLAAVEGSFDLIATNPPIRAGKKVVYGLMAEAATRLADQGELWVVIRTNQGAFSLERELERLFAETVEAEKGGGFRVYRSRKR